MSQVQLFETIQSFGRLTKGGRQAQRERLEIKFASRLHEEPRLANLVSYVGNKKIPILRIYRYKEAFSFSLVQEFIRRFGLTESDYLFDPFCGMGTTLFAATQKSIPSIGIDRLPNAVFVSQTLPLFYSIEPKQLITTFEKLRSRVFDARPAPVASDVAIMKVAFSPETLQTLRQWKSVIDELDGVLKDIFLLLFFAILEPCSYTSKDGQFLRLMRNKVTAVPEEALLWKVHEAEKDLRAIQVINWDRTQYIPRVRLGDTRDLSDLDFGHPPTAIITSPPYANRYDYTRTYSLELCFHFVSDFSELKALRFDILHSHIESKVGQEEKAPHPAIAEVVSILEEKGKELNNPRIPHMLVGYFVDMQKVIREWARVLAPKARVAMVVDNVRFEGEMVPVDLVLSEMAEDAGFQVEKISIARYKENNSQQMGKYGRVPVRESIVVWRKA